MLMVSRSPARSVGQRAAGRGRAGAIPLRYICEDSGCRLDLDVYANTNFTDAGMRELRLSTLAQGLWGSEFARTHTLPNLLDEMDSMRVQKANRSGHAEPGTGIAHAET